ncbi:MAG: hypothetical protein AAFX05_00760 [Planctomycetota bacterium]
MHRVEVDSSLQRREIDGFAFPLGVSPVEDFDPTPGFVEQFEASDGAEPFLSGPESEDWEEWPDRFMFDILISAERLPTLARMLFSLLPTRVYPILDVLGHDAYREIDPYIAYELVGVERIIEGMLDFGPWLYEDGLVGFGAMSMDPFVYVFIDEHKIATVRVQLDLKEKLERLLAAFDLDAVQEIHGADAVEHEHRSVIPTSGDSLVPEEIVERLRNVWMLQLNVAGDSNLDDDGVELGITAWRCVVRCMPEGGPPRYALVWLTASNLDEAEQLALTGVTEGHEGTWLDVDNVLSDRMLPEDFGKELGVEPASVLGESRIRKVEWTQD